MILTSPGFFFKEANLCNMESGKPLNTLQQGLVYMLCHLEMMKDNLPSKNFASSTG